MKFALVCIAVITLSFNAFSQKVYSTKTGNVSFESKTPLEDIEAKTSEVESKFAGANGQLVFTLLVKGFQFKNQLMEDHFNENYMESTKFPKADFKGTVTNIKEINFSKDGTYPAKVKGNLTLHGVTKEVESDGTITVAGGKVGATSSFNIKLQDYNIAGSAIGKKVAETITIMVNCQYD